MTAITSNRRRTLQLGTALATCIACAGLGQIAMAQSLPVVDNPGNAVITPQGNALQVDLRSVSRVIDWTSFSVGDGKQVNFVSTLAGTPTTNSVAVLNRVTGTDPSNIVGTITSQNNIKVWISNPNGIVFGGGGIFTGGSLVLTTLDDNDGRLTQAFTNSNLNLPARLSGSSTKAIELKSGSFLGTAADPLSGSVLAIAQKVVAGGRIQAEGDVNLVAASDVRFTPNIGSPLSFTILAGSSLSGVEVLGSGNVNGANVQVVAGTVNNMVSNLLLVDEGAKLTATDNDGDIILTAVTTGGATQSLVNSQIETQGSLTAGNGAGDVTITSSGRATMGGTIVAGRDVELTAQNGGDLIVSAQLRAGRDLSINGGDIALGTDTLPVLQQGGRNVAVVAANGAITGASGLTLRLNTGNNAGSSRILLDAGTGGTVTFAPESSIVAQGTDPGDARAAVGIRRDGATPLALGNVTASRLGDFTGSVRPELTGTSDFVGSTILTDDTFEAQFGGNIALSGVTVSDANQDVILNAGGALATTGLIRATRDITLSAGNTAGNTAAISGAVDAGDDYSVQGASVALGSGTDAITQRAVGNVQITAESGGTITGDAGLTLRSNRNASSAGNSLILDASTTGAINFALGSTIAAGSTASGGTNAAVGVRFNQAAGGSNLALGAVTGTRLGDYTGGTAINTALTGSGDLVARTVVTNQDFDATFGGSIRINSVDTLGAAADVTLRAGGLISGNQTSTPAINIGSGRNIAIAAGTDLSIGAARANNLTASAGSDFLAPAVRQPGSLSLLDGDVTGNVDLVAWGNGTGGDIRVGTSLAGGTLTLDNTQGAGSSGDIRIADRLLSDGLLQLRSAGDILVSRYTGSGTTGTVTSTNGTIDAAAAGSVLGYVPATDSAASAFVIDQAGIGAIFATGDLTVTTAGQSDLAVGSLTAGGKLTVAVDGNLYGRSQGTTQVPGAFFNGKTSVTVGAGTVDGVINLARVQSAGPVQLSANEIAVGTLASGGAVTLTAPSARTYIGEQRITGNATVTLGSAFADVGTVTPANFYAAATSLSAQDTINVSVTRAAQLGTVSAGGAVSISAGGLVANTVISNNASVSLTAASGTLALNTASAATQIALVKQGGSVTTADLTGDTVRFATLTAGTAAADAILGDVRVSSLTHIRGDRIDANGGNVDLAAGHDAGLAGITQAGEITGLSGGKMQITATDLADVTGDGWIVTRSGALSNFSMLNAAGDISIAAGGDLAPLNGAVRINEASSGGSLFIGNRNLAAGSVTGIAFGTLQADGDVTLITGPGNGGDVSGVRIDAGGNARVAAGNILIDRIVASDDVALMAASGRISDLADSAGSPGVALQAGGGIAADAGLSLRVDTAQALAGDIALRAAGSLTARTVTAGDDITIQGATVRLGTVTSTGLASDASDVSFTAPVTIADPRNPTLVGSVPLVAGGQNAANTGANIFVTATTGDVTGLAVDQAVLPALDLVTTDDVLSTAYGSAAIEARARNGSVIVSASNAAQLGAVTQGAAGSGAGNIAITAKAMSAGLVTAGSGNAVLSASEGTLVARSVSAFGTASLTKGLADPAIAVTGNDIRFDTIRGGQGQSDITGLTAIAGERLGVIVDSATAVRGDTVATPLGGARIIAISGQVEGRNGARMAIDASGAATPQNVTVRSATAIDLANVRARDRISIIAGATGAQTGRIALNDARSTDGSVYLTAVNRLAGSSSDITFDTLRASGEIVAITSGSNRGYVVRVAASSAPFAIDAGTNVGIDARAIDLDNVRAGTGTIALNAADFLRADDLQAGGAIAGLAANTIQVGNAQAGAGDVAFQAGGVLTVENATASDDILLSGSSVRVGTANALGGGEVANANFAAFGTIVDPSSDGVSGSVPAFAGTAELAGSSISVRASNDVTGLAVNPLDTPALALVTMGDRLSTAFGAANLGAVARNGSIAVTASTGAVQLGTVRQGTATTGPGTGAVNISGSALTVDSVTANTGGVSLLASAGTLRTGAVQAASSASLLKQGGSVGTVGDEIRFTTIKAGTAGADGTAGDVSLLSQTHVRGQSVEAQGGNATIRGGHDSATGTTTQAGEVTGLGFTATVPTSISVTASDLADVAGDGAIAISSGGRGEYRHLNASGDISVRAGGPASPFDGAIRIGTAQAGGNLTLSSRNSTAGTINGIAFDRLGAGGDVLLLTGSTNAGDATGTEISAGGSVRIAAGVIAVDTVTASGEAALLANTGSIVIGDLTAGGIGASARGTIEFTSAEATSGDLALLADAAITAGSLIAADDVSLSGTSLNLGTVTARGAATDNNDVDFANTTNVFDPADPGFTAAIPTVSGAKLSSSTGGNIVATAHAGDIVISDKAGAQASALFAATGAVAIATGSATTGSLGILAGGDVNSTVSLSAGEDIAIRSGGLAKLAAATVGDDLTVSAASTIAIDNATLTGLGTGSTDVTFGTIPNLSVDGASLPGNVLSLNSANGDIALGSVSNQGAAASGSVSFTAASGGISISRDLAVGGDLTILAARDITLGDGQDRTQAAHGAITVTSTGGAIRQGNGRLTLLANSDGSGAEALTLSAKTDVALGTADLNGGTARQSAVDVLASDGAITIGSASGASFTARAGTGFTANGAISTGSAALAADTTRPTVGITANNGSIVATSIDAAEVGHDVVLRASNAITVDRVTAARSIDANGAAAVTADTLGATSGTLAVASAGAIAVRNSISGAATSYTSAGASTIGTLAAGGVVTLNAGGPAILADVQSGGAASLASATTMKLDKLTTGGAATITAGSDATLGAITAAGDTAITANGSVLVSSVDTQGTLTVEAGAGATLGTLKAAGSAQLVSKAGSLSVTALTSGEATLNAATSVTFGTIDSVGAAAVTSGSSIEGAALASGGAANVTSGTTLKLDKLTAGGAANINAGSDSTLGTITAAGNTTIAANGSVLQLSNVNTQGALIVDAGNGAALGTLKAAGVAQLSSKTGALSVTALTSGGAGTLNAATDLTFGTIDTTGAATLTSGGATSGTSLVSSGAANVTSGTTLKLDKLTAGGTATITSGTDATLGTMTAVGDTTIAAKGSVLQLTSVDTLGSLAIEGGSGATLGALKAAGAAQLASKTGALSVTALTSGAATLNAATTLTFGTIDATGAATITSGGAITGTGLSSGGAANVTTGGALALDRLAATGPVTTTAASSVRIDQLSSGGATTVKAGTDATLGAVISAGDASIAAKGLLTLNGAFNAVGRAVTFTAKDAAIGADVTAATIRVVNDAAAGNKLILGDNAQGTGFALGATEIGRLKAASTLTFDAVSAPVKQDVSIGSLALAVPNKVLILADGTRIDVTGKVDVSGATTNLQLGGSGENAGFASVLRVAAKPDGTGGSIAAPLANVMLRAGNIAFGQDAGFLSDLGVTGTGTGDPTVALAFNDRASSTLYFAATGGGAFYTPSAAGVKLLTANNLTLSYTNFALFQNTGVQGQTSGVDVGSFLRATATGPQPVLGLFGTLAGREGTAASLLGNLAFEINFPDGRSSRINGCVIGEGAGCLVTLVFSPNLAAIDSVRPLLFTVASDYEVPFNPLIATNNDALFGDVGTNGLADIPLEPIECIDPTSPQCRATTAADLPQSNQAVPPQSSSSQPTQPEPELVKEAQ